MKGRECVDKLPELSQVLFYNSNLLCCTQEKVLVYEGSCLLGNQRCLIRSYLFNWTKQNELFALTASEYDDLQVVIKAENARTIGVSELILVKIGE